LAVFELTLKPQGAGVLKFTINVLFVVKMPHIKFEKNWSGGYLDVKNVLTHDDG
jgi:hypothetical protein